MAYITGTNIFCAQGNSTDEVVENIIRGGKPLPVVEIDGIGEAVPVGLVDDSQMAQADGLTRLERLIEYCLKGVTIDNSEPFAVILSTTKGNIELFGVDEQQNPATAYSVKLPACLANADLYTISTACISGVSAIVMANRLIGQYKRVVVIGADVISPFITSGFESFKTISRSVCKPFSADRDGLTVGEAVGVVVIESEPRTQYDVFIAGGAMANDANHISAPSRTGEPLAQAARKALAEAHLEKPEAINAHGTATAYNDEMESKAIALLDCLDVPLNSLKPYLGHTMGASGVIETIICAEQLKRGQLFATSTYTTCGTPFECKLSSVHQAFGGHSILKIASGFGGSNAAVVLTDRKNTDSVLSIEPLSLKSLGKVQLKDARLVLNGKDVLFEAEDNTAVARKGYKAMGETLIRFSKMDALCKRSFVAAEYLLRSVRKEEGLEPWQTAMLLCNRRGSMESDLAHLKHVNDTGAGSPAIFVYTLPNIMLGEIAIRHGIQGETTFFIMDSYDREFLVGYAAELCARYGYRRVIVGWADDDVEMELMSV